MLTYLKASHLDIQNLKQLWMSSFEDTNAGCNLFFDYIFNNGNATAYVAKQDNKICAALYLLPCKYNGKKSHYLYGASTAKDSRNQGIMGKLIGFALLQAKNQGDCYSFLLPASQSLYNYYKKFGYLNCCSIALAEVEYSVLLDYVKDCSQPNNENVYKQEFCEFRNFVLDKNNSIQWDNLAFDYAVKYNQIYGGKIITQGNSYAIVSDVHTDTVTVTEMASKLEDIKALIKKIIDTIPAKKYNFRLNAKSELLTFFYQQINADINHISFGMGKVLDLSCEQISDSNNIYIGLTMD